MITIIITETLYLITVRITGGEVIVVNGNRES
jgi:hypothetical protein